MFTGRVGDAPATKFTPQGVHYAQFGVAVNIVQGSGTSRVEETFWITAIAWGKLAEMCERTIRKGDLVFIEGKLQPRFYTDRNCKVGCKRTAFELSLTGVHVLDKKPEVLPVANADPLAAVEQAAAAHTQAEAAESEEEIPF